MTDITGKELVLGQKVVFNPPRYKGLVLGRVIGFTPMMVKVEYRWRVVRQTHVQPRDLAVVEKER